MKEVTHVLRAVGKLCSAINNIDQLNGDHPDFRGKLRMDTVNFCEWISGAIADLTIALENNNPEVYQDIVYHWMDGFNDSIKEEDELVLHVNLFLLKCESASSDLLQLPESMRLRTGLQKIIDRISNLKSKNYFKSLIFEDAFFSEKLSALNKLGEEIILNE